MATMAKCFFCGKTFDRDKEPFVKVNARRYAHLKCANSQNEEVLQEEKDKDDFYRVVKSIYGPEYNYILINKQATNFIEQYGYTWSGMAKCLFWFYNIKHKSIQEGYGGIGIIPYIYDQVRDYYYNIYLAEIKNKEVKELREPVFFNIQSPRAWKRPPHLLSLEEEEDE